MTRVDTRLLNTVIYLYASEDDAKKGSRTGGSGFLLSVASGTIPGRKHTFAVTNQHVAARGKVVRMNKTGGGTGILPLEPDTWVDHPAGDDLAVAYVPPDALRGFDYRTIHEKMLLTKQDVEELQAIAPGEDVCMVGRFITHEGREQNRPTVRFGNVSQMPWEPLYQGERGHWQESFLVEMRSHGAYSGSPVFNIYDPHIIRTGAPGDILEKTFLVGVDWGHIPTLNPVLEDDGVTRARGGWLSQGHSGQSGVVPAWRLRDLLDSEPIATMRAAHDEELARRIASGRVDGEEADVSLEAVLQEDERTPTYRPSPPASG